MAASLLHLRQLDQSPTPPGAQQQPQRHAPYAPTTASLGGIPTAHTDVPICAVFLALFLIGAVGNLTVFRMNSKKGHKFLMSGMLFGFCTARTVACILRIAWAYHPMHVSLAIAANVFVAAGVVLLFVINIIFAERIIRARHPHFGWHKAASTFLITIYTLIVITLIILITATIQSFYTLSNNTKRIDRDLQLYGQTFYALIALLPIIMVILGIVIPRRTGMDKFGTGRFRSKVVILLLAAVLLSLGAFYRMATNYKKPRPRDHPAGYQSKACFYIFNFTVEIIVVHLYLILRVDLRFHVPNGASKPGDYSAATDDHHHAGGVSARFKSEEEAFDDAPPPPLASTETEKHTEMVDEEMGLSNSH